MLPRSRARRVFSDVATWLATPGGMASLFLAGLLIRLILARSGGFPFDMPSFQAWAGRLADRGPWHFYPTAHEKYFVDYPPGYLYVLWIIGAIAKVFGGGAPSVYLVKMPPVLGDLALAWVVSRLAERLTPKAKIPIRGLAAAGILLNPAFFFVSAVWGQVDVFLAVPIVGAFLLLGTGERTFKRDAGGMALIALAIGTKPQGAFVLPMVVLLLVWRYMRDAERRREGFVRVMALGAIGVAAGFVLLAPFNMWPHSTLKFYAHSASTYPVTSVFAFNFWGAIEFWRADRAGDHVLRVLGIPAAYYGIAFFTIGVAFIVRRAWRALREGIDEGRVLVFGSYALSLVGFAVLTRIHERYLFLPLALGATLIGFHWLRRAFVYLSIAYLVNVYFPYVYYLRFEHRPAPTFGSFFDSFFGTNYNGLNMKVLSIFITVLTLVIASRGWRYLHDAPEPVVEPGEEFIAVVEPDEPLIEPPKPRWTLTLHAVGRREVLIALACFLVAFFSRVAMLGHPPGMYFDEVYHARTGAEYLGGKEVFEWTHPPLGKEFIGFAIQHWSNFGARGTSQLPSDTTAIGTTDTGFLWARGAGNAFTIHSGVMDTSCSLHETGRPIRVDEQPTALVGVNDTVFVATSTDSVFRFDSGRLTYHAKLPAPATDIALADQRVYVLTELHRLIGISDTGQTTIVASDVVAISQASRDKLVWAALQGQSVEAYDASGTRHAKIDLPGRPRNVDAIDLADRVYVSVRNRLISVESDDKKVDATMRGGAGVLGSVPETGIEWAASGDGMLRAIEPHAAVTIGRVKLKTAPGRLIGDPTNHQIVGVAGNELECASGRPQFAWRIGSAVFGAGMVGMLVLLAFILFGNLWVALLAGLFLTIEGVAFSVSRIAMVDSYCIAFLLAAWFCSLAALREWGARAGDAEPRRGRAIAWLAAGGVFGGLSLASKWVGLYALVGIALLFFWDAFARGDRSIWRVAGDLPASFVLIGVLYLAVPFAIYLASYIPYFRLGHNVSDFLALQKQMYIYHSTLKATHPFSSPWWGWPVGVRAVYLYLRDQGTHRAEMWTFPNLVVFWAGLLAFFAAVRHALRQRAGAVGVVILAALIQFVPWLTVSRVTFMYHYLADVPFLCLALAWWLVLGLKDNPRQREIAIGVSFAAVVFFFVTLPMLVGWSMPSGYLDSIRNFMPWVIK